MTLEYFLVANRKLKTALSSMSIASAWIWAPALFISAEIALKWGILGLLWFLIPNFLTLIFFAFFAKKLRDRMPEGFTLSGFIKERISPHVQKFYIIELLLLAICAISVQLIAGAGVLNILFPSISSFIFTILLGLIPMIYVSLFGIKASIVMDSIQYILMFSVIGLIVFLLFTQGLAFSFIGTVPFDPITLMLGFGIPTTIGLLSGAFGSQDFYQRAFAVKKESVFKAFIISAFMFVIIPIMLSCLGFIGAGQGLVITNTFLTNVEVIKTYLPYLLSLFSIVIISALVSTIDSAQSSASAIIGHDIFNFFDFKIDTVTFSRIGIVLVTLLSILIANSGITVLQLFLTYGAIRSSVFGISLLSLGTNWKLNSKAILMSLVGVILILVPINIYAILGKIVVLQTVMAISIVLIPFLIAYFTAKK